VSVARCYIGLGGNLGDPVQTLHEATTALGEITGTRLLRASSLWRTAPLGHAQQPDFINAVAEVASTLTPRALLAALLALEQRFGRERSFANAPRTLDLDLLLHGDAVVNTPDLTLPHPRMHLRAFVLLPLLEIAPGLVLPLHGPVQALLNGVSGQRIRRLD
jgi:2-amino-4-hydroxy-6-hydroxymethyldihydropteridine diphosphokinase